MAYDRAVNKPVHPWNERTAAARVTIARHDRRKTAATVVDDVDQALMHAVEDDHRLQQALADLDPDHSRAELKAALRARPDAMAVDTASIAALRQRHEAIADLENRLDGLRRDVDRLLIDLDTMVAQIVAASVAADGGDDGLAAHLQRVADEAAALEAAHAELRHL